MRVRAASGLAGAALALVAGCGGDRGDGNGRVVVDVEEVNGSGISGRVELRPTDGSTRLTVVAVEGGEITGIWTAPGPCDDDGLDDKHPVLPPGGIVQLPFELVRRAAEDGSLAVAFMRRSRHVACGES